MSDAITSRRDDEHRPPPEVAPSVLRPDEPTFARWIGTFGAMFIVFGGMALLLRRLDSGLAVTIIALGILQLLFHAAYDGDLQVRRLYWGLGVGLLVLGIVLCFIPGKVEGVVRPDDSALKKGGAPEAAGYEMLALFHLGWPSLGLALGFLVAVLRHETVQEFRRLTLFILATAGGGGAALSFVLGNNFGNKEFLLPHGTLLALMSLAYLAAAVGQAGVSSDFGFRAALLAGAIGAAAVINGLVRSALASEAYFVPWGMVLTALGLLYLGVSAALCVDRPLIVMFRRELAAFCYSPLFYLVLFGFTVIAYLNYRIILSVALDSERHLPEPIIQPFIFNYFTVLCVLFVVPMLTMRVLSEEKRSGTLEVLLTAPVKETSVVLSKFLATLLIFLLAWAPWWIFLVALRIGGGMSFEYNPVFSFLVMQAVTGAAFVAVGLFFSSLTSNQVASAVMTFGVLLIWTGLGLIKDRLVTETSPWYAVLDHIDYMAAWIEACKGVLLPRAFLFFPSVMVLFLYLTTKVLESRRWK